MPTGVHALSPNRDVLHVLQDDGETWVRGRTYKAGADSDGFTYVPFLGPDASRNWPVRFRLLSATLGGEPLSLAASQPRVEGDRVVLDRGAVEVRYDLALDSVEQSFAVADVAGSAEELVVRVEVQTDLTVSPDGAGFSFDGPEGGVAFGAATALDSTGRAVSIAATLVDGALEFRVPAAFVAASTGAVVVDPVVSTTTVDDFGDELLNPDVAFEVTGNTFCVVYEEVFSSTDFDIYYRTLDGDTLALVDEGYVEASTFTASRPRIASLAQSDTFLVAYRQDDAFARPEILARLRGSAAGSSWGAEVLIASFDEFFFRVNHDVGGEAFEALGTTNFVVVWEEVARAGPPVSDIQARTVDGTGVTGGTYINVTSNPSRHDSIPAVSKYSGDPIAHGAWWIVYASGPVGGPQGSIRATRMSFTGSITDPDREIDTNAFAAGISNLDVSAAHRGAYDEAYHVVFDANFPAGVQTLVLPERRTGSTPPDVVLGGIEFGGSFRKSNASYVTLADRVAVTSLETPTFAGPMDIFTTTIEMVYGPGVGIGERRTHVGTVSTPIPGQAFGASRASGGDLTSRRAFIAWHDEGSPGGDNDIFGALLEFPEPPVVAILSGCPPEPNSTGDIAFLRAYGDNTTTGPKQLRVTGLPSNALGYFLASRMFGISLPAGSSGRLCLSGSIGRYAGSVLNSGAAGQYDFVIDPTAIAQPTGSVAATSGDTWYFQAWHRDANPTSTSNFSSSVILRIQ